MLRRALRFLTNILPLTRQNLEEPHQLLQQQHYQQPSTSGWVAGQCTSGVPGGVCKRKRSLGDEFDGDERRKRSRNSASNDVAPPPSDSGSFVTCPSGSPDFVTPPSTFGGPSLNDPSPQGSLGSQSPGNPSPVPSVSSTAPSQAAGSLPPLFRRTASGRITCRPLAHWLGERLQVYRDRSGEHLVYYPNFSAPGVIVY